MLLELCTVSSMFRCVSFLDHFIPARNRTMKSLTSVTSLTVASLLGVVATSLLVELTSTSAQAQVSSRQVDELVELCSSVSDSNLRFQCLLNQSNRLNQAKNLARQRGERENGGVTLVEAEPSMHGPSAESPYVIAADGSVTQYTFTYRMRPRATTDYTQEVQVLVTYDEQGNQWNIDTVYNQSIAPTACSYASELQQSCF